MSARGTRLAALAVLGALLVNVPLLTLFDRPVLVLGVPLLWAYLFAVWAGLIAAVAVLSRPGSGRRGRGPHVSDRGGRNRRVPHPER